MKLRDLEPEDARLRALLRESPPTPPLPPRFQDAVWRRIERGETRPGKAEGKIWLEKVAALMLRPRLALASVVAVLLAGLLLGVISGASLVRQDAQSRYLAAVAPNALR